MHKKEHKDNSVVYHIPALLKECIEGLDIRPGGIYVDATFGGGGHSRAIMERLGTEGHLYSFDQDSDAYANRIVDEPRFTFVHGNFKYLYNFMRYYGVSNVDGILADLGVSFHHFDAEDRGFSFRGDGKLDMRMNRNGGKSAEEIVNTYSEAELAHILSIYGDLKRAGAFARKIISARAESGIHTTSQLTEAVKSLINPRQEKKELAQVFQALRIEVNGEMEALAKFLESTTRVLRPGARLVVLTYHSLEDRMVKNFMKSGNAEGKIEKDFFGRVESPWRVLTRNVITPDAEEINSNPRSRSAKLRIAEFIGKEDKNGNK